MKQQETELIVGNTKCKLIMDYHLYEHTPTSRSHTHTNYELIYVWDGEIEIKTDEQIYCIRKAQAALIAPNCYHQTITKPNTKKINVFFSFVKTGKRSSKTDVYSEFASAFLPVTISVIVGQTKIGLLLETLYRICLEEDFCKEERLQAELTSLIFTLYDLLINENTHYKSLSDKSMASIQYRYEIDTLLAQNCTKDIDLAFLSRELYLSPKRVAVLIKSLYGKPFRHVRTEMRIQFAKQLLKESDLTIAQIGKKIGYGSTRGFLNAFFVFAGCTPSDYRKKKYQQEKSSL